MFYRLEKMPWKTINAYEIANQLTLAPPLNSTLINKDFEKSSLKI